MGKEFLHFGGDLIEFLFQLILFVLIILVVYWAIKSGKIRTNNPKNILKERLAKGEISKKEYKEILKELEEDEELEEDSNEIDLEESKEKVSNKKK